MMRKVLLVTYHFPPSGAVAVYRMLGLVRYLPKFGWQPIVVAPPRVPWEPEDGSLLAQVPPATLVERVPFATGFFGKFPRYLAPEAHWLWPASSACYRMIREHQPAAILTTSPPGCVHLLGRRLQRKYGLPWLADFRDPWVTNLPITLWTLQMRFLRWLEAKVMRDANVLIANTPLNQRGWADAYPASAGKIVTITNGFDPERFAAAPPYAPGDKVTILHAGELYHQRDPRPLLDALRLLKAAGENARSGTRQSSDAQAEVWRLPLQIEFLGRQTAGLFDFDQEIRSRDLDDAVRLVDQAPYAEALERMMRADILLLVNSPDFRVGVPAKLYEYLGAGRPILALAEPESDVAWVLRESGVLHRIAPPRDVSAIKQALIELTHEVQAGAPAVPNRTALQQFTREKMAQKFAEALDRSVVPK